MMDEDEEITARLLRLAVPRPAVPAERAARVRQAITPVWQAGVRRRLRRRWALRSAVVLAAAAAVFLAVRLRAPDDARVVFGPGRVATVEIVAGAVERVTDPQNHEKSPVAAGDGIMAGDWVETSATARAALRLTRGASLRLDTGSRARLLSDREIELALGALYVDTGESAAALEVSTPFGVAHDIGTQFEVRLERATLRLRVRSGLVELRRDAQSIAVRSGKELIVAAGETVTRDAPPFGPDWEWAALLAPAVDIEGRDLASYLDHVCREQGWTLDYADAALASEAARIVLNGSVKGLPPADAVAVAVRISGLAHRLEDGELVIMRQ